MLFPDEKRNAGAGESQTGPKISVHPGAAALRRALRGNAVSFPSQIPILLKQPAADMQWRAVSLFFLHGWSAPSIASRFQVPKHRIRKGLNEWSGRAMVLGYVQVIDPDVFAACCEAGGDAEEWGARQAHAVPNGAAAAPAPNAPLAEPTMEGHGDVAGALDVAIARCGEWRGEFWERMSTLLREVRAAAAAALDVPSPNAQANELFAGLPRGEGSLSHGLQSREEERVYHAVA
jgi:hypothetical protein